MRKIGLMIASAVLFATSAYAYVPPSQFIVKNIASKRSGVRSVRVKSVLSAFQGGQPQGQKLKEAVWIDYTSHVMRSRMSDESGRELYAIERRLDANIPLVDLLLFDSQPEVLAKGLRQNGIPIRSEAELLSMKSEEERRLSETESIARITGGIAWVIGTTDASQLWVEKDTFLPVKLIVKSDEKNYDVTFDGFRFTKEIPYPKVMLVAGTRIESLEMGVNVDMAEMKSTLKPGFTEAGESLDSATSDLVRHFYQLVR